MELELKPCPFCGKNDKLKITHIYAGEDYIGCDRCKYDGVHIVVWERRSETVKPKKVCYFTNGYAECACKKPVGRWEKFCPQCGRKLDWSEV